MNSVRQSNRIAIIVAALMMVLGILLCPHTAFASGSIEVVSSTHDQDTAYSALMIADVDGNPIDSALDWNAVMADSRFEGLEGLALSEAVGEVAAVDAEGSFVSWLAGLSTGTPTLSVTCDAGAFDVQDGWYLLQATGHRPLLVWVRGDAVKIGSKMDTPSLTKEADKTTVGLGDEVGYTLTGTVPTTYDLYSTYKCSFKDTWDSHLSFKQGSLKVLLKQESSEIDITSFAKASNDQNSLTVSFDDLRQTPAKAGDSILVTYTLFYSTSAEDGVISLENTAVMLFPQGDEEGETPPAKAKVYTFHINIFKTDASNTPLAGAQFALQDTNGNWLAVDGSFGDEANRALFTSDDKGMITNIPNVNAGSYVLTEIVAPEGYALPADPNSKVTIAASVKDDELSMDVSASGLATVVSVDASKGSALLNVVNAPEESLAKLLPNTGDASSLLCMVGLMAIAIAMAFGACRIKSSRNTKQDIH